MKLSEISSCCDVGLAAEVVSSAYYLRYVMLEKRSVYCPAFQ